MSNHTHSSIETENKPENAAEALLNQIKETREERLRTEDRFLAGSLDQRKVLLLDYVRRGRQADGIDLQPDVIRAVTKLLDKVGQAENPLNELMNEDFDPEAMNRRVIASLIELEGANRREDRLCREILDAYGLKCSADVLVDHRRLAAIRDAYKYYAQLVAPEALARSKAPDPLKAAGVTLIKQLKPLLEIEDEKSLISRAAEAVQMEIPPASAAPDPIVEAVKREIIPEAKGKKTAYDPKESFKHFPTLTEYAGEVITPDHIEIGPAKENLSVLLKRSDVPKVLKERLGANPIFGATIIDGNLGYGETGELREIEGITVIDHHDQQEKRYQGARYDTATILVTRLLKERIDKANKLVRAGAKGIDEQTLEKMTWRKAMELYLTDFGAPVVEDEGKVTQKMASGREIRKLRCYVNHFDADSVLSTWAFRNPRVALKYKKIIEDISACGDFIIGSEQAEYGAGARDYLYIIENYINACEDRVKAEHNQPIIEYKNQMANYLAEALDFPGAEEIKPDPTKPIDSLKAVIRDREKALPELNALRQELGKTRDSNRKKEILNQVAAIQQNDPVINPVQAVIKRLSEMSAELAQLEKKVQGNKNPLHDKERILAHLHETLEDIITHPFKYQEFLKQGRALEQKTITDMNQEYRSGEKEVRPDEQDPGIIIIEPMAKPESVDGMYFFLRRRIDFNQPIVVLHAGPRLSFAISTQNRKVLDRYDFNLLSDRIKQRETEILKGQITPLEEAEKTGTLDAAGNAELKKLKQDLQIVIQGLNWRNRTQYIIRHEESCLSFNAALELLRQWKADCEAGTQISGTKSTSTKEQSRVNA